MSHLKRSNELTLSPLLPSKQSRPNTDVVAKCMLCDEPCYEKQKYPSPYDWEQFQIKASKWRGLDRYGGVSDDIDWDSGWLGKYWHMLYKADLCGERKLQQAIARSKKKSVADEKTTHTQTLLMMSALQLEKALDQFTNPPYASGA